MNSWLIVGLSSMTQRTADVSPRRLARITGLLYLLVLVTGIIAQGFISDRLVHFNDAAATATNILAHKTMFQLGFTVYLIEMASQIAVTALFYILLKPVNRSVALVSAFISLAGCTIKTASRLFFVAPLFILGGGTWLSSFNTEQVQALALLFLKVNDHGAALALGFFGFSTFLEGYLVYKSTFLPRFLGVWSMVAGL